MEEEERFSVPTKPYPVFQLTALVLFSLIMPVHYIFQRDNQLSYLISYQLKKNSIVIYNTVWGEFWPYCHINIKDAEWSFIQVLRNSTLFIIYIKPASWKKCKCSYLTATSEFEMWGFFLFKLPLIAAKSQNVTMKDLWTKSLSFPSSVLWSFLLTLRSAWSSVHERCSHSTAGILLLIFNISFSVILPPSIPGFPCSIR